MPLIKALDIDANKEVTKLAEFFNETPGYYPDSVLTMQCRPAIASAFINLNAVLKIYANKYFLKKI